MFLVKKIITQFFYPVTLSLSLCLLGLIFLWFSSRQRVGKILVSLGIVILLLLGTDPLPDALLSMLERQYPAFQAEVLGEKPVKYIVILGGGHNSDPTLPLTSQLGAFSLNRLVEGIRIQKSIPGSKLIVSGGAVFDPVPEAVTMANVAKAIGVSADDIILEDSSRDTRDEAKLVQPIVGDEPFILVTSAAHMPRSIKLFNKLGMYPVAAPTNHLVKDDLRTSPSDFFPNADALGKSEAAIHEYLGLIWGRLRGQI